MIFFVWYAALAIQEPLPLYQEEFFDEVALAQQRTVWLACLLLASAVVENERNEIIKVSQSFGHPYNLLVSKIAAETLEACLENVDFDTAAQGLLNEDEFLQQRVDVFKVVHEKFENKTLELTKKQADIVQKIKSEMNKVDDGFDQEPPIVIETLKFRNREKLQIVAGITIAVTCVWIVWKMFNVQDEKDNAKDKKRIKVD